VEQGLALVDAHAVPGLEELRRDRGGAATATCAGDGEDALFLGGGADGFLEFLAVELLVPLRFVLVAVQLRVGFSPAGVGLGKGGGVGVGVFVRMGNRVLADPRLQDVLAEFLGIAFAEIGA